MSVETIAAPTQDQRAHRASFFRQSGWLMIANVAGGALMWAVHFLSKAIPPGEYGNFGAFLAVVMVLPTFPLQMVVAQQTASALAKGQQGQLSGIIRLLLRFTFFAWLLGAVIVLLLQRPILDHWKIANPVALWLTMIIVLLSLWTPLFSGALQGSQNFLWLGWSMMMNAIGRIIIAAVAVLLLHAYAAGMLVGVLVGVAAATAVAGWHSRGLWTTPSARFDRAALQRQVVPLILAFLGFQILFTADTMVVKAYFPGAVAGFYVSAGTLSRALMWLVLPLAAVMFPRIVHSAAKSEKSNLMGLVLLGTAVLAIIGAGSLVLLGSWVVRFVFTQAFVPVATEILPWYAGAMVPLALANVLLNNLMARPESKWVLALSIFGLSLAYLWGLTRFHASLVMVLQTLGICNLALLLVCAWFTWQGSRTGRVLAPAQPI